MTILHKHLYTYHIEVWIADCERLNLTIKAKVALEAIAKFQGSQPEPQDQQRPQFTPECFVNTLAEFIVATDQVHFYFYFYFISVLLIIFVYSESTKQAPASQSSKGVDCQARIRRSRPS